jgi:anti-sigma regulatory factor (Ser/Thr protein kinase)/biotin operon repressor
MDLKALIIKRLERKGRINSGEIVKATGFSRAYINRFFQELKDEGMIVLIGKANRAHYVLASEGAVTDAKRKITDITLNLENKELYEDEVLEQIKKKTGIFIGLRKEISDILSYAFSEMLNNAIEHSASKTIRVVMKKDKDNISFSVVDRGVGIFNNIMRKKRLESALEAIQDLLKGKQTTMPKLHSGEGIFFTSKVADMFVIQGSNKKLIFNNLLDDVFIEDIKPVNGTKVNFSIEKNAKKKLSDIFRKYTDSSFEFSKTSVTVKLFRIDSKYISRSEARRIVAGLDKFKRIILDFKGIETIGQGFADEIFRVWKSSHPEVVIDVLNANDNVGFMIKRENNGRI